MSVSDTNKNDFIKKFIIKEICEKFNNEELIDFKCKHSGGFDGFMSELYTIDIRTYCQENKKEKVHQLIVKFMKENESFRISSKSYIQFPNEIFIYSKVLPYFEQIIIKSKSLIKIKNWIPDVYMAKYEQPEGYAKKETILVMKNLNSLGYRLCPTYDLNRQHLLLCVKLLAEYHSLTYVLRIKNDINLKKLIDEIIPLSFTYDEEIKDQFQMKKQKRFSDELDNNNNLYKVLYRLAFDRFYKYFDQIESENKNVDEINSELNLQCFFKDLNILRSKYFEKPETLLEYIRLAPQNDTNDNFPVILHGDYNRNNILFLYDSIDKSENPTDIKMIDFQELRYGTPAMDLSFLMYFNMHSSLRESDFWMELIQYYHDTIIKSISSILNVDVNDDCLKPYGFTRFYEHFSKYAFYGVLICLHFLPWKVCDPDVREKLGTAFANDMHGDEFKKISLECGGDLPDKLNFDIVKHAYKMGYVKNLL